MVRGRRPLFPPTYLRRRSFWVLDFLLVLITPPPALPCVSTVAITAVAVISRPLLILLAEQHWKEVSSQRVTIVDCWAALPPARPWLICSAFFSPSAHSLRLMRVLCLSICIFWWFLLGHVAAIFFSFPIPSYICPAKVSFDAFKACDKWQAEIWESWALSAPGVPALARPWETFFLKDSSWDLRVRDTRYQRHIRIVVWNTSFYLFLSLK